jgi:hypothetical protein
LINPNVQKPEICLQHKTKKMKHIYFAIAFILTTLSAAAQPTINRYLDYKTGYTIKRVNCSAGPVAGPAGVNQTWSFTNLTTVDTATIKVLTPTGTPSAADFPDATHVLEQAGNYTYIKKTAGENLMLGMVGAMASTKHPNSVMNAKRPFTFGNTAKDTFTIASSTSGIGDGWGIIELTGDGYGTLQLPNGTYTNVLRVKMNLKQYDTMVIAGTPMPYEVNATAYYWFHNGNASELLRIDTTKVTGSFNQTAVAVSYLASETPPVAIADRNAAQAPFTAHFTDQQLAITGAFKVGVQHEISLYNLNGQKLAEKIIIPQQDNYHLRLDGDLPSGVYLLSIRQTNSTQPTVIKLMKN